VAKPEAPPEHQPYQGPMGPYPAMGMGLGMHMGMGPPMGMGPMHMPGMGPMGMGPMGMPMPLIPGAPLCTRNQMLLCCIKQHHSHHSQHRACLSIKWGCYSTIQYLHKCTADRCSLILALHYWSVSEDIHFAETAA